MCDGQLFYFHLKHDLFMINIMKHIIVLDIYLKMILSLKHKIIIMKSNTLLQ